MAQFEPATLPDGDFSGAQVAHRTPLGWGKGMDRQESAADAISKHCRVTRDLFADGHSPGNRQ